MKFEIHTDYAIRILRLLHIREGEMLTAMEVAQIIGITTPVFTSIANQLRYAGILKTIQGRHGGYVLGKSANEISIYDVIVSFEGEIRINHCLETGEFCSHGEQVGCKAHDILRSIQDEFIERLTGVCIADLV